MTKEKIKIQNSNKEGFNKLLNPLEKPKKESKLEDILKDIEDELNQPENTDKE